MPVPPLRRILLTRAWVFAFAWGVFAYALHAVGNASGMYVAHWWFQILAHYVSSSAVALLVARVGFELGLRGRRLAAFVVCFSAVGAVSWEVVEYLGIFPNLHFWGIQDSLLDLTSDTAGVLTALFALRTRLRPVVDPTVETPPLSTLVRSSDPEFETLVEEANAHDLPIIGAAREGLLQQVVFGAVPVEVTPHRAGMERRPAAGAQ